MRQGILHRAQPTPSLSLGLHHHRFTVVPIFSRMNRNHRCTGSSSVASIDRASLSADASIRPCKLDQASPIAHSSTHTLNQVASIGVAVAELQHAVTALLPTGQGFSSGVVRIEIPIPRGLTAIRWLQGQKEAGGNSGQRAQDRSLLSPHVYFSGRNSSAPDTPETLRAEECTKGWTAVAGLGAAWIWQGQPGSGFDPAVMTGIQRFLSKDSPRIRVIGGTRFSPQQIPDLEWDRFGAYLFTLPLIELTEAANCCLLSVTIAWEQQNGESNAAYASGSGPKSLSEAIERALAALSRLRPPALPSAYAMQLEHVEGPHHAPSHDRWQEDISELLTSLEAAAAHPNIPTSTPFFPIDKDLAIQEYASSGQQGLDSLLSALNKNRDVTEFAAAVDDASSAQADEAASEAALLGGGWRGGSDMGFMEDGGQEGEEGGNPVLLLSKVVAARRSRFSVKGHLDPLHMLEAVQDRDPRAYQVYIGNLSGDEKSPSFIASTPERLYVRTGRRVASEAVAGTRPRGAEGDVEKDFWLAFDLLNAQKDHVEFALVRDWIAASLEPLSQSVVVEVPKSILKQGTVQHLYGRLAAELQPGINDAHLLQALHPTPAVCGRPREQALLYLEREAESFDRGYYAGPFGWMSGLGAEFVVAIRSALVHDGSKPEDNGGRLVDCFAGVGIVVGSSLDSEWQELDLKIGQYRDLLLPSRLRMKQLATRQPSLPLGPWIESLPNINLAWCTLIVEELCRQGITMFCIAPGSRSSPLTLAVAMHPRARLNVCIDERSLGFWALGYGRANPGSKPAVVITSSGTAVANLLPAAVEASLSHVPLLLLTADRPFELRDTAANQTIDQVKIFGSFVRWSQDVSPPQDGIVGRSILTTIDLGLRFACGSGSGPAGPIHLNLQFREPLAPSTVPWAPKKFLTGLNSWLSGQNPFTISVPLSNHHQAADNVFISSPEQELMMDLIANAKRGILVVGELLDPIEVVSAFRLASLLGWPVAADVLSGLRVGASSSNQGEAEGGVRVIHHIDHLLLGDKSWWAGLRPDVILQVGSHGTSKRLAQFLEWSALDASETAEGLYKSSPCSWIHVADHLERHDPSHLVTHRCVSSLCELESALRSRQSHQFKRPSSTYADLLMLLNDAACRATDLELNLMERKGAAYSLNEPLVARTLSRLLPLGHGLFLGNSMPIRDMDMYASPHPPPFTIISNDLSGTKGTGYEKGIGFVPVASNRGASGIDGVMSTAAGFAEGLSRPVTLVVGDLSFLHDINGLNLLRTREARPPLTVVLINNKGGGIFSFLPIAGEVSSQQFTQLWATPQHVDLEGICRSHGIPHQKVLASQSKEGEPASERLEQALRAAWGLNRHSVVEVVVDDRGTDSNLQIHRALQSKALNAAKEAYALVAEGASDGDLTLSLQLQSIQWKRFRLPLSSPLTTTDGLPSDFRQGLILTVVLSNDKGVTFEGRGEISPLPGLHLETLADAESEVALISQMMTAAGAVVPVTVQLLGGRLNEWMENDACFPLDLSPSVKFGIESALLRALEAEKSSRHGHGQTKKQPELVCVNGLVAGASDPEGAEAAAKKAALLVSSKDNPCNCIKIKVARKPWTPEHDASVVWAIRCAVPDGVELRADANQGWSLGEALRFAAELKRLSSWNGGDGQSVLSYIEEPVGDPEEMSDFFRSTGIKVAMDETLDKNGLTYALDQAELLVLQGALSALVIKPAVIGGHEDVHRLHKWAMDRGVRLIISSAFEGPVGISSLTKLVCSLEEKDGGSTKESHGLGTLSWFHTTSVNEMELEEVPSSSPRTSFVPAVVVVDGGSQTRYNFRMVESGPTLGLGQHTFVFLHGFLGSSEDWQPTMGALSSQGHRCVAIDLPGHGLTTCDGPSKTAYSVAAASEALLSVLRLIKSANVDGFVLVGYSLGARISLAAAIKCAKSKGDMELINKLVLVSGSAGLLPQDQPARSANDDKMADTLLSLLKASDSSPPSLTPFLHHWYSSNLWDSLRQHPTFNRLLSTRNSLWLSQQRQKQTNGAPRLIEWGSDLAAVLQGMSPGRMEPMLGDIASVQISPTTLVIGQLDQKYENESKNILARLQEGSGEADGYGRHQRVVVPSCGHAVHVERPLSLLRVLHNLVEPKRSKKSPKP